MSDLDDLAAASARTRSTRKPPPLPHSATQASGVPWRYLIAGLIVVVGLAFAIEQQRSRPGNAGGTVEISPADLVRAYEANEVRADAQLKGSVLRIRGKVGRIGKDIMDSAYVTIEAGRGLRQVQCFFSRGGEGQLMNLKPGDEVEVVGRCNGLMVNVLLKDCTLYP